MKRLFVILGLAACLISISSFAKDKTYPEALTSFFHTFHKAQNVNWTEVNGMLRIGFILDGQEHFAFYSGAELLVVATEIKTENLPAQLQNDLGKYKDYAVSQAYVLEKDGVKEYCVVLDKGPKHLILKGRNKWKLCVEERM